VSAKYKEIQKIQILKLYKSDWLYISRQTSGLIPYNSHINNNSQSNLVKGRIAPSRQQTRAVTCSLASESCCCMSRRHFSRCWARLVSARSCSLSSASNFSWLQNTTHTNMQATTAAGWSSSPTAVASSALTTISHVWNAHIRSVACYMGSHSVTYHKT